MTPATAPHLLTRQSQPRHDRTALTFLGDLTLTRARVHELCGAARRTLTLTVAAALEGPVIWIRPEWMTETLNADGVRNVIDPARLIFVSPKRADDLLWSMEEALRAGAVPLVVADLAEPPALTPIRRLHLAAETGAGAGQHLPLGLILTPQGNAPGVETRWQLTPRHGGPASERWDLARLRARTLPEKRWGLDRDDAGALKLGPSSDMA